MSTSPSERTRSLLAGSLALVRRHTDEIISHMEAHLRGIDGPGERFGQSEVAAMMSSVFLREIRHDGSDAAFLEHLGPLYNRKMGFDGAAAYFLDYFRNESKYDLAWRRTDFAETVLGRKPKTLRAWLEQHAAGFAPQQ